MRGSLFAGFVIVGAAVFARSHRVDVADVDAFVAELCTDCFEHEGADRSRGADGTFGSEGCALFGANRFIFLVDTHKPRGASIAGPNADRRGEALFGAIDDGLIVAKCIGFRWAGFSEDGIWRCAFAVDTSRWANLFGYRTVFVANVERRCIFARVFRTRALPTWAVVCGIGAKASVFVTHGVARILIALIEMDHRAIGCDGTSFGDAHKI